VEIGLERVYRDRWRTGEAWWLWVFRIIGSLCCVCIEAFVCLAFLECYHLTNVHGY
jgi:hypothetical protein